MNGTAGLSPEQRTARKRALTDELVAIRTQKADVLRQIQQIAKRQKTGGLPTKASELLATNNKLVLQMEQRNRAEKVRPGLAMVLGHDGRAQRARASTGCAAAAASPEAPLMRGTQRRVRAKHILQHGCLCPACNTAADHRVGRDN